MAHKALNPKSDILHAIDGEYWSITNRIKTDDPLKIPILPKVMELINKYKKRPKSLAIGTVFPKTSNKKLNSYLKEIPELCEIRKNLTFHLARRTIAKTITLTNSVSTETVSKLLGHSRISTTQIYAKVIERKINDDMLILRSQFQHNGN